MITVEQAVQNGIDWLDENYDGDWRSKINLDKLDMSRSMDCILGQLYGSYWHAPKEARDPMMGTQRLGDYCCEDCTPDIPEDFSGDGFTYDDLDDEWRYRLSE